MSNTLCMKLPRPTVQDARVLEADLRLFRFDACDDDCEFYVRAPSRVAAYDVIDERYRTKKLRIQPRVCTALDTKP